MALSMKHIVFLGFGFSAKTLASQLDQKTWHITGTSRSEDGAARVTALGFHGVVFEDMPELPADTTHVVVSIPPDDAGCSAYRKFKPSLLALKNQLQWIGYLSTTGVYGDHGGGMVDENFALTPNTTRGEKRVQAEKQWLELFKTAQLPVHIFRLAGIYGPGRNQLLSLQNGSAKRIIKAGQIFSRIHVADIAGVLAASIAAPRAGGIYNLADDEPCPPQDVVAYAAAIMGLPVPADTAFEDAKLSAMAASFYADSKRVSNALIKREFGYQLLYPNYRVGLTKELKGLALTKPE
jgi:nucleoside-diphosphate-sugar epimerase